MITVIFISIKAVKIIIIQILRPSKYYIRLLMHDNKLYNL